MSGHTTISRDDAPPVGASFAYRPALDGLRAVAVMAVVFFHAGALDNGFIGVDVFFVLSGYLVTSILLVELSQRSTVSLRRFYARRVRRLLPASAVVVVACAIVGLVVRADPGRDSVADDARWSALYAANWRFVQTGADYFADTDPSPYRHFWSLAVEEQFYIVFPLVVLAAWRLGGRRALTAVAVVIGAASLWRQVTLAADGDALAAYFRTDARLYQLLAGVLLALAGPRLWRMTTLVAQAVAGVALTLVVVATTTAWSASPSSRGIVVAGVSVVLLVALEAAPSGPVHQVLASRPLVRIGQVSYGMYLWHWPIWLVLDAAADPAPWLAAVIVAVASWAIAEGSAHLIETPIRSARRLDPRPRFVVAGGLAVSAAMAVAATVTLAWSGPSVLRVGRLDGDPVAETAADASVDLGPAPHEVDWRRVYADASVPVPDAEHCRADDTSGCVLVEGPGRRILLVGDSHALALLPYLESRARRQGHTLMASIVLGCGWGDSRARNLSTIPSSTCARVRADWSTRLVREVDADIVVLVQTGRLGPADTSRPVSATPFGRGSAATVKRAVGAGARVVIVESTPPYPGDPLDCLADMPTVADCTVAIPTAVDAVTAFMRKLAKRQGVRTVDLDGIVCSDRPWCPPYVDGHFVYRDNNHVFASWWLFRSDMLDRILAPAEDTS